MAEETSTTNAEESGWRAWLHKKQMDFVKNSTLDDSLDKFMKKMERPMKALVFCEMILIGVLFFLGITSINWLKDTREDIYRADAQFWNQTAALVENEQLKPMPGYIVDAPGKSCSLLYGMGRSLATKAQLDASVKEELVSVEAGVGGDIVSIGETDDFECPGKAGDSAICTIGSEYETSDYYRLDWLVTGLIIFTILKPIGSKIEIMDLVLSLLFFCVVPKEKRKKVCRQVVAFCSRTTNTANQEDDKEDKEKSITASLMLQFTWLNRCKRTQNVLVNVAMYLRFKVAPNMMMLPLTTLAYNSKCPQHLYMSLPGSTIPHTVIGMGAFDVFWLTIAFLVANCKPDWVKKPWFAIFHIQGYILLAFLLVTFIISISLNVNLAYYIGFNFNLAFAFNIYLALDLFQLIASVVTITELVLLVLHSLDQLDKTFDKANAEAEAAGEGAPRIESL